MTVRLVDAYKHMKHELSRRLHFQLWVPIGTVAGKSALQLA